MDIICLQDEAFFSLIEQVIERITLEKGKVPNWLPQDEAMQLLNIKSKTTLQKLRDEGQIRFTQPQKKIILYDRESIDSYLNRHARNTF